MNRHQTADGRLRFVVDRLINGEGYVIVDRTWREPMIGPYPLTRAGRRTAERRAADFNEDPSTIPPRQEGTP